MEEVRRLDDGELCGHVDRADIDRRLRHDREERLQIEHRRPQRVRPTATTNELEIAIHERITQHIRGLTRHDLLNAPFATLATVGASGRPQLTTTYFLASADGTVQLSVNATRQKLKNMVANPKVALHIQDTVEYVRYLELRGDATVEPDDDSVFAVASAPSTAAWTCATWTAPASAERS